ncbi:Abnormal spindle-like microcephaly-associated protein-like [Hondaea fermentalgiana]|uniref:Abnormal spindle-like microcephaly-associated protein-like n=1 Tax=Hondaea fermentalgiana TaxID=2315210 RepID=A0A2R5G2V0_9STRA|nr:Abnormal spindle-like microcephaly-associated protein-like [Hondaea fermentalgiana]|eukprot:GBG24649.1 Abnormal spindle-like microcephaly-associated protein-like [Hondaea fermentalgiana]
MHPLDAAEPLDLSFQRGEIIKVLRESEDGWNYGENLSTHQKGYFPINFVSPCGTPEEEAAREDDALQAGKMAADLAEAICEDASQEKQPTSRLQTKQRKQKQQKSRQAAIRSLSGTEYNTKYKSRHQIRVAKLRVQQPPKCNQCDGDKSRDAMCKNQRLPRNYNLQDVVKLRGAMFKSRRLPPKYNQSDGDKSRDAMCKNQRLPRNYRLRDVVKLRGAMFKSRRLPPKYNQSDGDKSRDAMCKNQRLPRNYRLRDLAKLRGETSRTKLKPQPNRKPYVADRSRGATCKNPKLPQNYSQRDAGKLRDAMFKSPKLQRKCNRCDADKLRGDLSRKKLEPQPKCKLYVADS